MLGEMSKFPPSYHKPSTKEPPTGISYPVGDLCRHFTKLTWPSAYTLHSDPTPQTGHQCFQACFCHSTVWNLMSPLIKSPKGGMLMRSSLISIYMLMPNVLNRHNSDIYWKRVSKKYSFPSLKITQCSIHGGELAQW